MTTEELAATYRAEARNRALNALHETFIREMGDAK